MRRVLELAKRGEPFVSPNPMVGAVLVRKWKIVAEGWHKKYGGQHAEVEVLKNAQQKGKKTVGCELYVNLEPCVHLGKKTPPCVPEIIKAGIRHVVVAMKDPNPKVNGGGIRALRKAGVKVDVGCLKKEAETLNEKYVKWMTTGMPFIGMKVAMSLDGKIATKTGDSKWITGESARAYVKKLRDSYDAILVGRGTVTRDNPTLAGEKREPKRIILDSTLALSLKSNVLRDRNVILVTTRRAKSSKIKLFQKRGIQLKIFPKKIALTPLLRFLGVQGISSILVEGGAEIFGSFIDARLVDRFYWFIAPKIIGGRTAKTAVAGSGISALDKALLLSDDYQVSFLGGDVLIEGKILRPATS